MDTRTEEELQASQTPNPEKYYHSGLGLHLSFPVGAIERASLLDTFRQVAKPPKRDPVLHLLAKEEGTPKGAKISKMEETRGGEFERGIHFSPFERKWEEGEILCNLE
ncbi:unnamed protein product [Tuber aestivum]|uniref:Uncharacterized protein n=1 Tax=Tuber aestivum TaxID=59557 RepID=A0A292Q053_9PEZI|nr:unnamed protein product [Tuber aestivum]